MIRVAAVLLSASLGLAAPVLKEKGPVLYFPTQPGAKLVFELRAGGKAEEVLETVTGVEARREAHAVTVERRQGGRTTTTVFEVSAKGVFRPSAGAEPVPLLKLPAVAGDAWTTAAPGLRGGPGATYVVGPEEEVEVPAGTFRAIPVANAVELGGRDPATTVWFAPHVGIVKSVSVTGAGERTLVLKSFTPGQ